MTGRPASPLRFLAWVLVASVPLYALNLLPITLPLGLPPSVVMIVVPLAVAIVLRAREGGRAAVGTLLSSAIDVRVARPRGWLAFSLLFPAALTFAGHGLECLRTGRPWGEGGAAFTSTPPLVLALVALVYLVGAIPEELGWTTYATGPLQRRFGVLWAGALIGAVWLLWHVVPFVQQGREPGWIIGQVLTGIGMRAAMGLMFEATAGLTFPALVFHMALNAAPELLPRGVADYAPVETAVATWAAVGVMFAWRGRPRSVG